MKKQHSEQKWIAIQRKAVVQYLQKNVKNYNNIGEWPAWHVDPYFAIWAIESSTKPGWVGYWVFSGDIPTDVIERDWCNKQDNPRSALARLIIVWDGYVQHLKTGCNPPGVNMGRSSKSRMEMGGLLGKRIDLLSEWRDDSSMWPDDCIL